jgi:hypothetical protein
MAPHDTDAHGNLGFTLAEQAICAAATGSPDFSAAEASYRDVLRTKPGYAEIHVNLAMLALLQGDFDRGWRDYEWRWRTETAKPTAFRQPAWDGGPCPGKTILLHAEQGFGDTLHFVRYAALVKERGATVCLLCPPQLQRLLTRARGVDYCYAAEDEILPFDAHASLMSLPRLVGTALETIPSHVPYLSPDPELVDRWRGTLDGPGRCRVGIVWQGNPGFGRDAHRSLPLSSFAPLAAVPGVALYSLQKGAGVEQLAGAKFPIVDIGSQVDDFVDTAAVIQNLDLVVACDTACAHLAGALGRPVWTLLPLVPDWRWLLGRADSPWYPTMRLYRRRADESWLRMVERAAADLNASLDRPALQEAR